MPRLTVRPEAELDALEAAAWYEGERAGLGTQFLGELRATFSRIDEGPPRRTPPHVPDAEPCLNPVDRVQHLLHAVADLGAVQPQAIHVLLRVPLLE